MAKAKARSYRSPVNVQRFGFWLKPELIDRARNAVVYLAGHPEHLTLSGLVTQALEARLTDLERKHHKGKPFPKRVGQLRPGSRPKA